MKRSILAVTIASSLAQPAFAEVPRNVHELCLSAADYAGCVNAQRGIISPRSRLINQQGMDVSEGNACPAGYGYVGGGNCKEVECSHTALQHNETLIEAGWQKCPVQFLIYFPVNWGLDVQRAFNNPTCRQGTPSIGYNSTCHEDEKLKLNVDGSLVTESPKRKKKARPSSRGRD